MGDPSIHTQAPDAATFPARVRAAHLVPLWEVMRGMLPMEPRPTARAHHWPRSQWHPAMHESVAIVSAEQAERRVLLLENPGLAGESRIAATMNCGLQLLLPGERAHDHRHSQTALRFVIEGEGAVTIVDDRPIPMQPGDFVLTPAYCWHAHENHGTQPVVWLDGLDVPLARFMGATFFEPVREGKPARPPSPPPSPVPGESTAQTLAPALAPVSHMGATQPSPVHGYPYGPSLAALRADLRAGQVDAWHGVKRYYANPQDGGHALPTISAYLQLLPGGFEGRAWQSTEAIVYCVAEGSGRSMLAGPGDTPLAFDWGPGDCFVVPGWVAQRHSAHGDAVLFSFSDGAAQQRLGMWQERRLPD